MKKILITLLLAVAALPAAAQYRWGPVAGAEISGYHFKNHLFDTSNSPGFSLGVMGEIMFPGIGFGMDISLLYNMHGGKLDLGQKEVWASEGYGNQQCWIHALRIPVNLKFRYSNLNGLERIIAPFAYAGPYFSITVGHNKVPALQYPAGCFGLQCGLGAEILEKIQVSGGYAWGMSYELQTVKLSNISGRSSGWQVKVAYLF